MDRKPRSAEYGPSAKSAGRKGITGFFVAAGTLFHRKTAVVNERMVWRRKARDKNLRRDGRNFNGRDLNEMSWKHDEHFAIEEQELEEREIEELEELEAWHEMVHEVAMLHREREDFQEVIDRHQVEEAVAEAHAMMRVINEAYGWEPGEPSVADRMFGTNVRALLAHALTTGKLDFRTKKAIDVMRSVGHGSHGGGGKMASIAAVRNLVGGVTGNEAQLLADQRRLDADNFAEYVGFADKLSRAEEMAIAHHLGKAIAPLTSHDYARSVADGRALQWETRRRTL